MSRDVAIVGWGQTPASRRSTDNEVLLLYTAIDAALDVAGLSRRDIGFTVSGSCDYLTGGPFAFVTNLEAAGAWPPISESHVEMDGAWALYEAWVRLQLGDVDTALVFGSGKSSPTDPAHLYPQQLDPYLLQPLGLDPVSLAGLQARALLDAGKATEADFAAVVARSRRAARTNPNAQLAGDVEVTDLLAEPYVRDPLRRHDLPPISDGAAAVVLAAGDVARTGTTPVWIRGIDHRVEPHQPGMRDLTVSASTAAAAAKAGVGDGPVDVAELSATFSPQELILADALGLGPSGPLSGGHSPSGPLSGGHSPSGPLSGGHSPSGPSGSPAINPSGGPLAGNPVMATGLVRFVEVASRIASGEHHRGVAHATGGQLLQHNLVAVLEGS